MIETRESFQQRVNRILHMFKFDFHKDRTDLSIHVANENGLEANLRPITLTSFLDDPPDLPLVTTWRQRNRESFFSWINATEEGTRKWFEGQVMAREDRILFMLEVNGNPVGHIGLSNFDYLLKTCELDNVIRGKAGIFPGGMRLALKTLLHWTFDRLGVDGIYLRVFSDNVKALRLYENCGFSITKKVAVQPVNVETELHWIETNTDTNAVNSVERFVAYMVIERETYFQRLGLA